MWRALQSRHLAGIEFDPDDSSPQYVNVSFVNGALYRTAAPVPRTTIDSWVQSSSAGSFFHDMIEPVYGMLKIADGTTKSGRRSRRF